MRSYTDTSSQQARQFDANAAIDAAEVTRRRSASVAKIRAAHAARQKCRAERAALEAAYNLGSVKTGADYERFVANILTGANIPTFRVGQSGDYGADLLANTATGTAVIQCKFYTHPRRLRRGKRGLHRQSHLPRHRRVCREQRRVRHSSPQSGAAVGRDAREPRRNRRVASR